MKTSLIRKDFPYFNRADAPIYFDNAATTHKPQCVLDSLTSFYTQVNANVGRGIYQSAEEATRLYEQAREKVARFIGADPHEIIFTSGTTDGINLVAHSWGNKLKKGQQLCVSNMEHHSNLIPWQQLANQKGAQLNYIPLSADGTLKIESLPEVITEKTKLVATTYTNNVTGVTNDIPSIVRAAHKVGAVVLVDATQTVAHKKIDVRKLDCDFLVLSGHKMFGPMGIGILYVKKEILATMQPYKFGGGMVFDVSSTDAKWHKAPHAFEAGTPPIAQAIALGSAVDYLSSIDCDQLQTHEAGLCSLFIDGLQSVEGAKVLGPVNTIKKAGHMVSFVIEGIHAHDVAAFLDHHRIAVRAGHHCAQPFAHHFAVNASVRVSFSLYNTQQEVQQCIDALKKIKKI